MKPPGNADTLLAYRIGVNSMTLPISISQKRLPIFRKTSAVVCTENTAGSDSLVQAFNEAKPL